jgi:hypothetical protein
VNTTEERFCFIHSLAKVDKPFAIYVLLDDEGFVRYVGFSKHISQRMSSHWTARHRTATPVTLWLRTLSAPPEFVVIDRAGPGEAPALEAKWIAEFHDLYPGKLLNVAHRTQRLERQPLGEGKELRPIPDHERYLLSRDGELWSRRHGKMQAKPFVNVAESGVRVRLDLIKSLETIWGGEAELSSLIDEVEEVAVYTK